MTPRRSARPGTARPGTARQEAARPAVGTLAAVGNFSAVGATPAEPAARVAHQRRLVADLCRMLDPQPGSGPGPNGHAGSNGHAGANGQPREGGPNGEASTERVRSPLPPAAAKLSPRLRQTLERLLAGDSEKEIAARFGRSRHTIHVYVKKLYERFNVSSRGELLARFVRSTVAPLTAPPVTPAPFLGRGVT
jgi:DNA-binding CsgD family transcriptional regulator